MRRAPPARTSAGQFAGAARQEDEDFGYAAESEDQDEVRRRQLLVLG